MNALRVCVYIYIWQLIAVRAPTWFIDLIVATCHIQYIFLSLCKFFHEKTDKTKILEVRHFRLIQKWPPTVTRRAKH